LTIYQLGASVFHASILNYYILVAADLPWHRRVAAVCVVVN